MKKIGKFVLVFSIFIGSPACATMVKNALEAIPLSELVIYDMKETSSCGWSAIVIDSKSLSYKVQVGDFMGKDRGKIIKMELGKIYLEEIIPDGKGGWTKRSVVFSATTSTFKKKYKEVKSE